MPLIKIEYFEQEFTDNERSGIIRAVTDAMVSFTGEAIRPHTWVLLEEVRSGNWGIGGHALGLSDVRALQRTKPHPRTPVTAGNPPRDAGPGESSPVTAPW